MFDKKPWQQVSPRKVKVWMSTPGSSRRISSIAYFKYYPNKSLNHNYFYAKENVHYKYKPIAPRHEKTVATIWSCSTWVQPQIILTKWQYLFNIPDSFKCHLSVCPAHGPRRIEVLVAGAKSGWVQVNSQVMSVTAQVDLETSFPGDGWPWC